MISLRFKTACLTLYDPVCYEHQAANLQDLLGRPVTAVSSGQTAATCKSCHLQALLRALYLDSLSQGIFSLAHVAAEGKQV